MFVWLLDLQLPAQLVPITNVVSSNPADGEVYSMQHYVIKLVRHACQWFLLGTPVSATNKTNRNDIYPLHI